MSLSRLSHSYQHLRRSRSPHHAEVAAVSYWNYSSTKRLFDLLFATVLLVAAVPLMIFVALLILITSPGPVFFRQLRSGKDGRNFQLMKFRTMYNGSCGGGPKVTRAGDPRITRIGAILRRWKLDELPQLWNVVHGDMSFVGPRPDVPEYLAALPEAQRAILSLRPGLTGVATLHYRHEEQMLSMVPGEELNRYYCTHLLPEKARLDLDYACNAGWASDLAILLETLLAIFEPVSASPLPRKMANTPRQ